jgi:hypothetical protein
LPARLATEASGRQMPQQQGFTVNFLSRPPACAVDD